MNSSFTFKRHQLDKDSGKVSFFYTLQTEQKTYDFSEVLSFPIKHISWDKIPDAIISKSLDTLLLILGISYWKTYCPKIIHTPTITLTKKQADFWNIVYTKGLGEFFYINKIDYRGLVNFPYQNGIPKPLPLPINPLPMNRSLVFFGGGKDSIVSAELLKKNTKQFSLFMTGESAVQKNTAALVGTDQIIFEKEIDSQIFELHKQPGVYNGHIPISAVWAFLGVFAALLYDYQYIIVSNEHSANYGNVKYLGEEINHQWSKSFEFENLFGEYITENITPNISYFSLLRPLHELQIMQLFIQYPQYFSYFSSCNKNFKIILLHPNPLPKSEGNKKWCGACPKCVFVFILLAAFMSKEKVLKIFKKNLLDDPLLLSIIKELLGKEAFKPFACVGTPEETQLAFYSIYDKKEFADSLAMQFFIKEILSKKNRNTLEKEVFVKESKHIIPAEFQEISNTI